MQDPTTVKLLDAIEALPPSTQRDLVLRRARQYIYHDFKSDHPTPKMLLYQDLAACPGSDKLREDVMRGVFDETKEEAEEWYRLLRSPLKELLG